MKTEILTKLNTIARLKTVGALEVFAQLSEQPLQSHQLPAAILIPVTVTAEANPFIGGHIQRMNMRVEILLITPLKAASRHTLAADADSLPHTIAKALAGLKVSESTLEFQTIEPIEIMSSLQTGQLMQRVVFTARDYIHQTL